ncbi:DUF4926 domain-containing protein [Caldilinea sp.]|uniref:DUF4926 domain-containing protein n=1 Tax=Caldilinea sp. TaxID=2293560 RepID=UPI0031CC74B1
MKLELYKEVALLRTIPGTQLRAGDVAVLVEIVPHPAGGEDGALLEVFNAIGESIAVVTAPCSVVARLRADASANQTGKYDQTPEALAAIS